MNRQKYDRVIEVDIAFDVMDAAIHRCLSNTINGFVEFDRTELTRATIVYIFSQYQLGNLGKIRLDKLGNDKVEISLFELLEPLSPNQQKECLESIDPFKRKLAQDLAKGIGREQTFIERRRVHYRRIIDHLLIKLNQERIWNDDGEDNNKNANRNLSIGGNVTDSNVVIGNNNVIDVNQHPVRKRKS